jgi:hypothetical protein
MKTRTRAAVREIAACVSVLLAGTVAGGAIRIGPPLVLPRPAGDARDAVMPAVAFDGKGTFLVAWQQGRDYHETETSDILCARVSADGLLLDDPPLAVCAAEDSQMRSRVALGGDVFFIVWQDLRSGKDFGVYGSRVTPAGEVLDTGGLVVADGPRSQSQPSVAPGDNGVLVAWQEFIPGEGNAIRATRVAADGRTRDRPAVSVAAGGRVARGGDVALARTRGGWFAFWRMAAAGLRGGAARLVEEDGVLVTAEIAGPMPHFSGVLGSAASDGAHVLYAGTAISGRGWGFRPCTALLFDAGSAQPLSNPNPPVKMGASGWNTERMICLHAAMPGVDGTVATAWGGGVYLVVAQGSSRAKPPHRHQVFAARVSADGRRLDDVQGWHVLDDGARPAANPAVAAGRAGRFLVVHESDGGPGLHRLVARTVDVEQAESTGPHQGRP